MSDGIDAQGMLGFLQQLVRTPSVTGRDGPGEAAVAQLVAKQMRAWGWETRLEEFAPNRQNVVATIDHGLDGRCLLFEGHSDVVTAGNMGDWDRHPFSGDVVDGWLYGRGAADMKGGVAAMMFAARTLSRGAPFRGLLMIAVLGDEEGMMAGAKSFVARGHARDVDAAVVCEPEGGEVCLSQKGAIRLHVRIRGRMAHGAMPAEGRNPLPAVAALVTRLAGLERKVQQQLGSDELLGAPYITPTVIRGGTEDQLNVIPADAVVGIDVRTLPAQDHPELIRRITQVGEQVAREHAVGCEVTVVDDRPPTVTDKDAPIARAIISSHAAVTGSEPRIGGVPGTTDGTILWRDASIPVVVYGPGEKWIAHQPNERVALADVITAAQVYVATARSFLRDP